MMISRQISSRNQRNKGFMCKYSMQICLLLAICFWLLYQMKHSHDKRKEIEEKHSSIMNSIDEKEPEIFQINRKTFPIVTDMVKEAQNQEGKGESGESLHMTKLEEIEDEGKNDESGEIFEQDQEKADEEAERGEFADEEDRDEQVTRSDLVGKEEHDAGIQQAREESFNGDDASNAVTEGNRKSVESGHCESSDEKMSITHTYGNKQQEIRSYGESSGDVKEQVASTREREDLVASFMNSNDEAEHGDGLNMKETVDSDLEDVEDVFKVNEPTPVPGIDENISNEIVINGTDTETRESDNGSLSTSTLTLSTDRLGLKSNTTKTTHSDAQAELQSDQREVHLENTHVLFDLALKPNDTVESQDRTEGTSRSQETARTEQLKPNGNNNETLIHMEDASVFPDVIDGRKHSDTNVTIVQMEDSSDTSVALGEHLGSAITTEDPNERLRVPIVNQSLEMTDGKDGDVSHDVLLEEQKESQVNSFAVQSMKSNDEVAAV